MTEAIQTETITKTCKTCTETRPVDDFNVNRKAKDGRQSSCKSCGKAYDAKYRAANRERLLDYYAKYRAANPDRKTKWYAANREHVATYNAQYRADSPHAEWEGQYRSRARAFGFDPVVRSFTREDLISRYGDACVHCGGPFEELDHFPIPVGLGGVHAIENCRPSCAYDNRANSAAVRIARKAIAG